MYILSDWFIGSLCGLKVKLLYLGFTLLAFTAVLMNVNICNFRWERCQKTDYAGK